MSCRLIDVPAGSGDLADVGDAAGSVAHARNLHDEVDGRGNLRANRLLRQGDRAHHGHGLDAGDGVAGIVGVDGGDGAVVAGVHGLQHVQRFLAADLAQDDAVGPHAQRVDDQLALANGSLAFEVGRTALQPGHVLLLDLQFGGVFDGDDALGGGDESGEDVEQRGFARAGAAGDDNVEPRADCAAQDLQHLRGQRAMAQQVVGGQRDGAEAADGQQRAIHGQRRNDDVDARSVQQARIHHRRRLIDAAAHRGDDLVDDVHQMGFILEDDVGLLDDAAPFDVDGFVGVDQDVVHGGIVQQRLQRAQAKDFVENVVREAVAIGRAERGILFGYQLQDHSEQTLASALYRLLGWRRAFPDPCGGSIRGGRRSSKRDAPPRRG